MTTFNSLITAASDSSSYGALLEIGQWLRRADSDVRSNCMNAYVSGLVKASGVWGAKKVLGGGMVRRGICSNINGDAVLCLPWSDLLRGRRLHSLPCSAWCSRPAAGGALGRGAGVLPGDAGARVGCAPHGLHVQHSHGEGQGCCCLPSAARPPAPASIPLAGAASSLCFSYTLC